jgi:hypothetical protein
MPSRPIIVAIVVFWLATAGWLFYRDYWPSLQPGEPPPYTIDLVDEARRVPIHWIVYRDEGKGEAKVASSNTSVEYHPEDDTFELANDLVFAKPFEAIKELDRIRIESSYRVTREGELRYVQGSLKLFTEKFQTAIEAEIKGPVEKGWFIPEGKIVYPGGTQTLVIDPVPVAGRGSILNPQHPLNRILGLRLRQHWRVPLLDPVALALSRARADDKADLVTQLVVAKVASTYKERAQPRTIEAQVLPQPEMLNWFGRPEVCLVIEYHGGDTDARTWVRESDGLVLQQEATVLGDRMVLKRNP